MYTVIDRRKVNRERMQETMERAQKEFFPKLRQAAGFVGFYLVADTDNGVNNVIVVWDDKAHADMFVPEADAWQKVLDEMGHKLETENKGETLVSIEAHS